MADLSKLKPSSSEEAEKLRAEIADLVKRSLVQRDETAEIGEKIKDVAERISRLVPPGEAPEAPKPAS